MAQNSAVTQAGLCAHEGLFMENHTDHLSKDGSKGTKAKMVDLEEISMGAEEIWTQTSTAAEDEGLGVTSLPSSPPLGIVLLHISNSLLY